MANEDLLLQIRHDERIPKKPKGKQTSKQASTHARKQASNVCRWSIRLARTQRYARSAHQEEDERNEKTVEKKRRKRKKNTLTRQQQQESKQITDSPGYYSPDRGFGQGSRRQDEYRKREKEKAAKYLNHLPILISIFPFIDF
ncbi:uncharacterized protein K452DRAFT_62673 [Aplosporella prunicola CBS 121167]|uniref:Uncharacterized protein n=1 Tax=Aplosporella prunicola CBS 121167 TaxID=1176127 RepID=A0A6A6B9K4_9PEZI|nr:uncharacterized protein K452DRAFT_62673 [Aplosporella prunicola CBS 121167]KAF2139597.1 hypothetical protein K452DRAFT_62673 [Aplosporella prunicola CBS 121167]